PPPPAPSPTLLPYTTLFRSRALALATASGDVVLHALANYFLGIAYQAQSDYRRAIDCFGQTVVSFEGVRRRERFGQVFLPAVSSDRKSTRLNSSHRTI